MDIRELEVPDVKLGAKAVLGCAEHFSETWSDRLFREEIANETFVQDNQSISQLWHARRPVRGVLQSNFSLEQGETGNVMWASVLSCES